MSCFPQWIVNPLKQRLHSPSLLPSTVSAPRCLSVSCGQRHVDVDMTYSKFSVLVIVVPPPLQKKSLHIKSYIEFYKEVNVNLVTFFCLFFASGPNRGHYITIVKSHGFWLLFDDDIVEVGKQMIISEGTGVETVFWDVCIWTFSKIDLYSRHLT